MYGELPTITLQSGETVNAYPILIDSSPTGPKTAALRLPTTDEMIAYFQVQKSVYKDLGRRSGEAVDCPNPAADHKLFDAIRLDRDGAEFDDAEVQTAITKLTRHRVTKCEKDGGGYVITLSTQFGVCTHSVRIPYESEKAEYLRSFMRTRDLPHGVEERRFPIDAPIALYDKVIETVTGYFLNYTNTKMPSGQGGSDIRSACLLIPPHHKRSVINELMSTLSSLDPDLDPNS